MCIPKLKKINCSKLLSSGPSTCHIFAAGGLEIRGELSKYDTKKAMQLGKRC